MQTRDIAHFARRIAWRIFQAAVVIPASLIMSVLLVDTLAGNSPIPISLA